MMTKNWSLDGKAPERISPASHFDNTHLDNTHLDDTHLDDTHLDDTQLWAYVLQIPDSRAGDTSTGDVFSQGESATASDASDAFAAMREHLSTCLNCSSRLRFLERIETDLANIRAAQPRPDQMERYKKLFAQIGQEDQEDQEDEESAATAAKTKPAAKSSALNAALDALRLVLQIDTRTLHSDFAVRNASTRRYRLLYSARGLDLELLLEQEGSFWAIQGDLLAQADEKVELPCLVQLRQRVGENSALSAIILDGIPEPPELIPSRMFESRMFEATSADEQSAHFQFTGVPSGLYELLVTPFDGPLLEILDLTIP